MFSLRTLGGLWLEQETGTVVEVRGRGLALLAMIAADERGGASRDRILSVLWPELDQVRASHNLSQLLYSVRRSAGEELTSADARTLRLDSTKVRTDLDALRVAIRDSDGVSAAQLVTGPFLAGFYLENAPEFERWCAETRSAISRSAEQAIELYAEQCDRTGQSSRSRALWRQLADLDPLNSRMAYEYVLALAKCGDRGGAVRHGRAHIAALLDELGAAPPTRLVELMERLQRGTFVSQRDDFTQSA